MSGVETTPADQTPVDSHAEGGETGAVCPKTPSPTDIQERETIARIIDPGKWRVLDTELERVRRHHPNGGYDPDNFKDHASLAKADAILALRSNPQPGSEGWKLVPVQPTEAMLHAGWLATGESYAMQMRTERLLAGHYRAMLAASPTPPTPQPGEVERLRSALTEAVEFASQDFHCLTPAGEAMLARWEAALTPSESQEADRG